MAEGRLRVEVAIALPQEQRLVQLLLPAGATVADALAAVGLRPGEAGAGRCGVAVFGKEVAPDQPLRDGDRVEWLRPLAQDPKSRRRDRARLARGGARSAR